MNPINLPQRIPNPFAGRARLPVCVRFASACLLAALSLSGGMALAQNSATRPALLRDVGIEQRLGRQVPLSLAFQDETGKTVRLRDYFGRQPVILSLVYFNCPMLCTMVENGLLESLKLLKFDVGDEFEVLTVSFNPHDTPELAAAKKAVYVGLYGRQGAERGWHFLTGNQVSIRELTKAVGFNYAYDAPSQQYAHSTAIMILTPEGKLSRYFFGIQYPAGDLRLSLVEASDHKIGSPVDAVILYCCQYNPATGKYGLIISRVIRIAGLITLLSLGTLMLVMFRAEPRAPA